MKKIAFIILLFCLFSLKVFSNQIPLKISSCSFDFSSKNPEIQLFSVGIPLDNSLAKPFYFKPLKSNWLEDAITNLFLITIPIIVFGILGILSMFAGFSILGVGAYYFTEKSLQTVIYNEAFYRNMIIGGAITGGLGFISSIPFIICGALVLSSIIKEKMEDDKLKKNEKK